MAGEICRARITRKVAAVRDAVRPFSVNRGARSPPNSCDVSTLLYPHAPSDFRGDQESQRTLRRVVERLSGRSRDVAWRLRLEMVRRFGTFTGRSLRPARD